MSNIYLREKFCTKCGTATEECAVESYDKETGKRNTRDVCTNIGCIEHCNFHNKHVFPFWGFGAVCLKCGYERGQYM